MTDQTESLPDPQWAMPEPDEPTDYTAWTQPQAATVTQVTPAASRYPYQLADHLITVSFGPNKPASVTVRGNSAVEIAAILEELAAEGVYTQIAHATQIFGGATPPAETVMRSSPRCSPTPAAARSS